MIHWLLRRLESNPTVLFSPAEVPCEDGAVMASLFRRAGRLCVGDALVLDGEMHVVLRSPAGGLVAVPEDDGALSPVILSDADLEVLEPDRVNIGQLIRDRFGLTGTASIVHKRVVLVGEHSDETAVVLGLFTDADQAITIVAGVRPLIPKRYKGLVVVAPSLRLSPTVERHLENDGIAWCTVLDDALNTSPPIDVALASVHPGGVRGGFDPATGLRFSADFRTIVWRGRKFGLGALQAAAFGIYYQAYRSDVPDIAESAVLEEVESKSASVKDLFKGTGVFEARLLGSGVTKGTHRLLPEQF